MARLCGKKTYLYEVQRQNNLHSESGKARISKGSFLLNNFFDCQKKKQLVTYCYC